MEWPLYVSLGAIFGGILGLISMWAWLSASVILFLPATTWWPKWVDIVAYNLPYAGIAVGTIGGSYLLLNFDRKGKAIGSFLIFWRNSCLYTHKNAILCV
jgi:hypothetical protein